MDYLLYWIIGGISLLITMAAQGFIKSTYSKYSTVMSKKGMTGAETARLILDNNQLKDVKVEEVQGYLSDHYDPSAKTVRLSVRNYRESSISAVAVAAHECGHAIQDKDGYSMMRLRHALVPIVNLTNRLGYVVLVIGLISGLLGIVQIGIILEAVIVLFHLVTLPVEIDASRRALKKIEEYGILDKKEHSGGKQVLKAAAFTYVAGVLSSILEILRLILIYGRRNND